MNKKFDYGTEHQDSIYFIPSPTRLHPGDIIASVCHIGIGDYTTMKIAIDSMYKQNISDAPNISDVMTKACFGGDGKLLTVGTVLQTPFHYNERGEWVKNNNKPEEEEVSHFIVNDVSLFNGCSGTYLFKVGDSGRRFVGIHFSGNYYPHVNALLNPSDQTGESISYNLAVSVHHPAFVVAYAKHIVPSIPDVDLPLIWDYLRQHRDVIQEHAQATFTRLTDVMGW